MDKYAEYYTCCVCGYTIKHEYPSIYAPPTMCPHDHYPRGGMTLLKLDPITQLALKHLLGDAILSILWYNIFKRRDDDRVKSWR